MYKKDLHGPKKIDIDGSDVISYHRCAQVHAEEVLASGIGTRWVRLNISFYHDPKVRRARCAYLWPYLLVLMGEHRGYIPDDYLDPSLVSMDLGLDEGIISDAIARAKSVGLLIEGGEDVDVGGRGGPHIRTKTGWTTPNWREYQPDPRGAGRTRSAPKVDPHATPHRDNAGAMGAQGAQDEVRLKSLRDLESLAIECISTNGRRGRPLCLDPTSARTLMALAEKYGLQRCAEELSECGGAERPVAMLKKRLEGSGRKKRVSPPSREAWRKS